MQREITKDIYIANPFSNIFLQSNQGQFYRYQMNRVGSVQTQAFTLYFPGSSFFSPRPPLFPVQILRPSHMLLDFLLFLTRRGFELAFQGVLVLAGVWKGWFYLMILISAQISSPHGTLSSHDCLTV